jgi:purine/pyrimidine-nucleoside phosphorylase
MSEFTNVTVVKKANIYFDGKVTSRTIIFADGTRKTLGVLLPGEYTFNTGVKELMEIQSGLMAVQLAGETSWRTIKGGESFEVPADSSFTMRVQEISDYICSFLP